MMQRRGITFCALFVVLTTAGVVVAVAPAQAATVTCGQVVTQDTVLDGDVGACPGNGIVIGASDITLDLNGHTVFGSPATPTPPGIETMFSSPSAFNGIYITLPHNGVRIRNGTVSGFGEGVTIYRSRSNTVERLVIRTAGVMA